MTVFVLMREIPHEFCDCWGVFTSRGKAAEHRDKLVAARKADWEDWEIYERVLDEGDPV